MGFHFLLILVAEVAGWSPKIPSWSSRGSSGNSGSKARGRRNGMVCLIIIIITVMRVFESKSGWVWVRYQDGGDGGRAWGSLETPGSAERLKECAPDFIGFTGKMWLLNSLISASLSTYDLNVARSSFMFRTLDVDKVLLVVCASAKNQCIFVNLSTTTTSLKYYSNL